MKTDIFKDLVPLTDMGKNELNQLAADILDECPSLIDKVRLNKLLNSVKYLCTETLSKIHERI